MPVNEHAIVVHLADGTRAGFGTIDLEAQQWLAAEYVTTPAVPGTSANKGSDTVIVDCTEPTNLQFTSAVCVPGDWNIKGVDTEFTDCTGTVEITTTNTNYTTVVVFDAKTNTTSNVTTPFSWDTTATVPLLGSGIRVSTPCQNANSTHLGVDVALSACTQPIAPLGEGRWSRAPRVTSTLSALIPKLH